MKWWKRIRINILESPFRKIARIDEDGTEVTIMQQHANNVEVNSDDGIYDIKRRKHVREGGESQNKTLHWGVDALLLDTKN